MGLPFWEEIHQSAVGGWGGRVLGSDLSRKVKGSCLGAQAQPAHTEAPRKATASQKPQGSEPRLGPEGSILCGQRHIAAASQQLHGGGGGLKSTAFCQYLHFRVLFPPLQHQTHVWEVGKKGRGDCWNEIRPSRKV